MAGDWIPLRTDLLSDPAVFSIAARTGLTRFDVVGRLHAVWSWASHHVVDGMAEVGPEIIDQVAELTGFADSMIAVAWLGVEEDGKSVFFPSWDDWNSQSAKKRMKDARRKSKSRNDLQPERTNVRKKADKQRTSSGQKRDHSTVQKSINTTPQTPQGAGGGDSVDEIGTSDPAVSACKDALRSAGLASEQVLSRLAADPSITPEIVARVAAEVTRTGGGPGAIASTLENQEARDAILAAANKRWNPEQHRQAVDRRTAVRAAENAAYERQKTTEQEALRSVWKAVASQDKDIVLAAAELFCNRQPSAPVAPWKTIDPDSDPATWPVQNRLALQHVIEERQATVL